MQKDFVNLQSFDRVSSFSINLSAFTPTKWSSLKIRKSKQHIRRFTDVIQFLHWYTGFKNGAANRPKTFVYGLLMIIANMLVTGYALSFILNGSPWSRKASRSRFARRAEFVDYCRHCLQLELPLWQTVALNKCFVAGTIVLGSSNVQRPVVI